MDAMTDIIDVGERFRGYVVERLIGKGGYGAVYQVRHEVLDTPYALKVLDPEIADEKPEYVKRFVREAKLASALAALAFFVIRKTMV